MLPFEVHPSLHMSTDGSIKISLTVNHRLLSGKDYVVKNLDFKLVYSE